MARYGRSRRGRSSRRRGRRGRSKVKRTYFVSRGGIRL